MHHDDTERDSRSDGRPVHASPTAERAQEQVGTEQARQLALEIAAAGLEKRAIGVEIIDVSGKLDYTEFLILMSGRTDRHVHAIAKGIEEQLRRDGTLPLSVEGMSAANWVLLDFNDVVVHVFQERTRCYYDLEGLWIDASRIPVPERAEGTRPPSAWGGQLAD